MKKSTIKLSELKELIRKGYTTENSSVLFEKKKDEKDEDEDVEVDVDDVDIEVDADGEDDMDIDMDMDADMGGGDENDVLQHLMSARKEAKNLGDEKLLTQIGNTITYLTRKHIAGTEEDI